MNIASVLSKSKAWLRMAWDRLDGDLSVLEEVYPLPHGLRFPVAPPKEQPMLKLHDLRTTSLRTRANFSILTQDLRNAGFGAALDAVEAAEAAIGKLAQPEGLTTENVSAALTSAAAATSAVTTAAQTAIANPVATGEMAVADAVNFIAPFITTALTKKASTPGTVTISDIGSLISTIQAFVAKL